MLWALIMCHSELIRGAQSQPQHGQQLANKTRRKLHSLRWLEGPRIQRAQGATCHYLLMVPLLFYDAIEWEFRSFIEFSARTRGHVPIIGDRVYDSWYGNAPAYNSRLLSASTGVQDK